jgi:hypothetical protein
MLRFLRRLLLLALLIAAAWLGWTRFGPYDPAPWLADLDTLEVHTATAYANLDWQVAQGIVDPAALHQRTDSLIRNASNAGAARRALIDFGRAFGDGHYHVGRPTPAFVESLERLARGGGISSRATPDLDGHTACARLGYGTRDRPSLLASAPGWRELVPGPFQAGLVPLENGRTAGVLRIQHFGEDGYARTCEGVWEGFRTSIPTDTACEGECEWRLQHAVAVALLAEQREAVRALKEAGVELLVVDITRNGGGTDWVEPAARQLVARPIAGILATGVRHPHTAGPLAERRALLARDSARSDLRPAQRAMVESALARVDSALASARTPCDRSPIWHGALPEGCTVLYAPALPNTGVAGWAPDSLLEGLESADELYWPATYRYEAGVWNGPLVILVDGGTASASEGFAAQLRDAGAARVVGSRTFGAGCGYMNGGIPLRLPHSGLQVRMPDCARLRTNGMNEVAGITPDVDAGWTEGDDDAALAVKAVAAIAAAMRSEK